MEPIKYDELKEGTRIYYTGDMANIEDEGTIIKEYPPYKWHSISFDIRLDDGRVLKRILKVSFKPGPGRRFLPLAEWEENRRKAIAEMQKQYSS